MGPVFQLFASFGLVFIYCELCGRISTNFDEIKWQISQLNWYLFPMNMHRILPIVMINAQQPVYMECFGSIPSDRSTFQRVSKLSIGTFFDSHPTKNEYWERKHVTHLHTKKTLGNSKNLPKFQKGGLKKVLSSSNRHFWFLTHRFVFVPYHFHVVDSYFIHFVLCFLKNTAPPLTHICCKRINRKSHTIFMILTICELFITTHTVQSFFILACVVPKISTFRIFFRWLNVDCRTSWCYVNLIRKIHKNFGQRS